MKWVTRARLVTTFRDRATGEVLRVANGFEFDVSNPKDWPKENPELRAAMDHFRPRRNSIDIEVSLSYAMNDETSVWDRLDAPVALTIDEPTVRPATPGEIAGLPLEKAARKTEKAEPPAPAPTRRAGRRRPRADTLTAAPPRPAP